MKLGALLLTGMACFGICAVAFGGLPPAGLAGLPGGWSEVATDDPGVKAAAGQAVSAQAAATGEKLKLVSVKEAQQQVVAGMKYRLVLVVRRDGKEATATAVIWAKLDKTYQLMEWSWAK